MAGASLLSEWLNRVSSRSTWKSAAKVYEKKETRKKGSHIRTD